MYKNNKFDSNDSDDFELEKKKINDQLTNQMYLYSYFHNMFRKPSCVEERQLIKLLKKEIENLKNQLKNQSVSAPIRSTAYGSVEYGSVEYGSAAYGSAAYGATSIGSCLKSVSSSLTSIEKSSIPIVYAKSVSEKDLILLQQFFELCYDNKTNSIDYLKYKKFIADNGLDEKCFLKSLSSMLKIKPLLDPITVAEIIKLMKDKVDFKKTYGLDEFKCLSQELKRFKITNETLKMYLDELGYIYRLDDLSELLKEEDLCNEKALISELTNLGVLNSSGLKTKQDIEQSEFDTIFANIGSSYIDKKSLIDCLIKIQNIFVRPNDLINLVSGDKCDYFPYIFTKGLATYEVKWELINQNKNELDKIKIVPTVDEYKRLILKHLVYTDPRSYLIKMTETNIELIKIFKQYGIFINYEYTEKNEKDSEYKIEISKSIIDKANKELSKKKEEEIESKKKLEKIRDINNYKLNPGDPFNWTNIKKQNVDLCDHQEIKNFFVILGKAPSLSDLTDLSVKLQNRPVKLVKSLDALIKCLEKMYILVEYDVNDNSKIIVYANKKKYLQDTTTSIGKTSTGKKSTDPIDIIGDIFTSDISKSTEAFEPINVDEMFNFDFSF